METSGRIRLSLSSYFDGRRLSDMTEEERREIAEHFKAQGAAEVEFY